MEFKPLGELGGWCRTNGWSPGIFVTSLTPLGSRVHVRGEEKIYSERQLGGRHPLVMTLVKGQYVQTGNHTKFKHWFQSRSAAASLKAVSMKWLQPWRVSLTWPLYQATATGKMHLIKWLLSAHQQSHPSHTVVSEKQCGILTLTEDHLHKHLFQVE